MTAAIYEWTADRTWKPLPHFLSACEREFTTGQRARLEIWQDRSRVSHDHYFACLAKAWDNMSDALQAEYGSETRFRRWALVQAGYYTEKRFIFEGREEALRFVTESREFLDEYSFVVVVMIGMTGSSVVAIRRAKSQSMKAMGKRVFQESKQAVIDIAAKIIGVDPTQLRREAKV